ncbi:MAG: tyrosine-type recombinase/integrase [Nanoarchaeota archaeon]|nr:tyrosine-type recombinase/integrase [Nanoarchaeota archaeon]MBU1028454.1 tyrosine-type recombinase/integrase [Nanoarchaeota archaeon]
MKLDPYNHKERYLKWRASLKGKIPQINKYNSDLILRYLDDMENGVNVAQGNAKGSRSYIRLNTLREKMKFFSLKFKERYNLNKITEISEEQLCVFFSEMKRGIIKRVDGKTYKSTAYSVKCFKAFWHWWMKVNRKKGGEIRDITVDLDTREEKPKWVYLSEEQVKKFCENVKYEYRVLITFLFDTGIRAPTELMNIKVSDLSEDCKELQIREEISKTFGRRIKLMICSDLVREYIKTKNLDKEDYLFQISPSIVNQYLKRIAVNLFGDKESLAGEKYSQITMYDFRHISCCYWLPRYKSESALKFRFGWKGSDKIHYYSEMLGMRDTITEDDLLIDITKTEIEKRLTKSENEKTMLQDRVHLLEGQMKEILKMTNRLGENLKEEVVLI